MLARDLARWLLWRMGAYSPQRPPLASPAPMLRSRASPGSDARHWSPDVILGFAEYALSFPIYSCLPFPLSLPFRQSLLYDSQFNISIRTRLISTTRPYIYMVIQVRMSTYSSTYRYGGIPSAQQHEKFGPILNVNIEC